MRITLQTDMLPGRASLLAILDACAWATAAWYLAEINAGREPPCCNDCAELKYIPDRPSPTEITLLVAPHLLTRGHGSCGELAALDAGRRRAAAIVRGLSLDAAGRTAWVDLYVTKLDPRTKSETWHAIVRDERGAVLYDPAVKS